MRKFSYALIILSILTVIIYFCKSPSSKDNTVESPQENEKEAFSFKTHIAKYEALRESIASTRKDLQKVYTQSLTTEEKKQILNQTKKYLVKTITKDVFKFWYGTKWSYEGTTETPLSGEIACGYFVSTILRHCEFNIDRYKLAKQPSSLIVKTLCHKRTIKTFNSYEQLKSYFENNSNSLYILGLDNHVGFIFKYGDEIYFIHSSYTLGRSVMDETLEDSVAISSSKVFVIGNMLDNIDILGKWLKGDEIKVISM